MAIPPAQARACCVAAECRGSEDADAGWEEWLPEALGCQAVGSLVLERTRSTLDEQVRNFQSGHHGSRLARTPDRGRSSTSHPGQGCGARRSPTGGLRRCRGTCVLRLKRMPVSMAHAVCRWALRIFVLLYAFALAIGLVGTYGWFGQARDPLSWVFVIILGQPWVTWLGAVSGPLGPWLAALAPILNLVLLAVLCRVLSARQPISR